MYFGTDCASIKIATTPSPDRGRMTTPPPTPTGSIWDGVRMARRNMIVGLAIVFVSQWFQYGTGEGVGVLSMNSIYETHGVYWFPNGYGGTGWEMHPVAPYLLPVLACIYFTALSESVFWRKWGYLLTVVLAFPCLLAGEGKCGGCMAGLIGACFMIWGSVLNRKDRKAEEAAGAAGSNSAANSSGEKV